MTALGKVAVIGGGINGLCMAWELSKRGWAVELFERGRCLSQTSSSSTKLLHGGLRYLEQGHLALVAESLRERARWLSDAPEHAHWLPLLLPIYRQQRRAAWQWQVGLGLYDGLALGQLPGFSRWLSPQQLLEIYPELSAQGLQGAWQFWDGQMDEQALGDWVLQQARQAGALIHEHHEVLRLSTDGSIWVKADTPEPPHKERIFDWVVNACGPWAARLLAQSDIHTDVRLDLVRGSHLLVPPPPGQDLPSHGLFVEVTGGQRIAFLLPYQGHLLVGTTEETQDLADPIHPSQCERELLLKLVLLHLPSWDSQARAHGSWFAGLRPIVHSSADVSRASRDAVFRRHQRVISVFGGKWTTARALAERLTAMAPFNGLR
jgi:glycerol-3-phosphate dehydrogenase